MAYITLEKTWARQRGSVSGTSGYEWAAACVLMKDLLVASGHWTVTQSSNSVSAGAADYWSGQASIVYGAEGVAHSWIVLRNTEILGGNFEVCIAFDGASRNVSSVYCTHVGYNANGTTTNKPTAISDEQTVTDKQSYSSSPSLPWKVLVLTSSDGQCTRVIHTGEASGGGACGVWMFDKLKNPPAWLTVPYIAIADMRSGSGDYAFRTTANNYPCYVNFCHATGGIARAYHAGTPVKVTFGSIGVAGALGLTPGGRIARMDTGAYPVYPVYAISQTAAVPGFLGELFDILWLPGNFGDNITDIYNTGTVCKCPLIYLPTADQDQGMFNWGVWAFGDTGEGGLF